MRAPQRGALRWPSRWAWAQAVLALAVTAVVALLWCARPQAGPIARLDGLVQDAQTQWRGRLAPGTTYPITLVQFDDASAARFGSMAPARPLLANHLGPQPLVEIAVVVEAGQLVPVGQASGVLVEARVLERHRRLVGHRPRDV